MRNDIYAKLLSRLRRLLIGVAIFVYLSFYIFHRLGGPPLVENPVLYVVGFGCTLTVIVLVFRAIADIQSRLQGEMDDRQKAEEALRQSESLLRTAVESLPFDFFVLDSNSRCIMLNSQCKSTWGNGVGKTPEDFASDDATLSLWQANVRRAFSGRVVDVETALSPGGKRDDYRHIIAPIRDADKVSSVLGVNIDISRRKESERRLRESEQRFRDLAALLPDGRGIQTGIEGHRHHRRGRLATRRRKYGTGTAGE